MGVARGVGYGSVTECAICMMTCSGYSDMCDTFTRVSAPFAMPY